MRMIPYVFCLLIFINHTALDAGVIRVRDDYQTVQEAIDNAVEGDTVLVEGGFYSGPGNTNIDFLGKAIIVMSENGSQATYIICGSDRGFLFVSGETGASVLQGFTINSANVDVDGAAIYCVDSSPTITGNVISGNRTYYGEGGGIFATNSSITIIGNTITSNQTGDFEPGGLGGGIYCSGPAFTISSNTITYNNSGSGGGIYCSSDSLSVIEDNIIMYNSSDVVSGGGISCYGTMTIRGNIITDNHSSSIHYAPHGGGISCGGTTTLEDNFIAWNRVNDMGNGGGIYCGSGNVTLRGNTILENRTEKAGGGIACSRGSQPLVVDNRIMENSADHGGGLSCARNSSPLIKENTIAENSAVKSGGGLYVFDASPEVHQNLFAGNWAGTGGGIDSYESTPAISGNTLMQNTADEGGGISCRAGSSPTVINCILRDNVPDEILVDDSALDISYCDVAGGWPGPGTIDSDPLFVYSSKQDFRLLWGSPCIDSGSPDSLDADGTRSDMGSFPFEQDKELILYLTPDTSYVEQGDVLGVTYTVINRWPYSENFLLQTEVKRPGGEVFELFGPDEFTIPPTHTAQLHVQHRVPRFVPPGEYEYRSVLSLPSASVPDKDVFTFSVIEPDAVIHRIPSPW